LQGREEAVCGRSGFSAQNAHGCPDGSGDEEKYGTSIFSQILRYGIQVFKTNRNEKQESGGVSFH
jgi:hypothetical protein